mmetsp:Transcript_41860/g.132308  ORF Transcript_41860/g.132308 Transcript_41860/m.132308 type:complete len:241 (+) Transcript_41860:584-1306(+)
MPKSTWSSGNSWPSKICASTVAVGKTETRSLYSLAADTCSMPSSRSSKPRTFGIQNVSEPWKPPELNLPSIWRSTNSSLRNSAATFCSSSATATSFNCFETRRKSWARWIRTSPPTATMRLVSLKKVSSALKSSAGRLLILSTCCSTSANTARATSSVESLMLEQSSLQTGPRNSFFTSTRMLSHVSLTTFARLPTTSSMVPMVRFKLRRIMTTSTEPSTRVPVTCMLRREAKFSLVWVL